MQSQDYPAAKWAIGLRASAITDADVERAFNAGDILRTHVLRPTWHFVVPADIRWMLALTGPRVHNMCAHYYRKLEVEGVLARSRAAIERALVGGKQLTRHELATALRRVRISADGVRLAFLIMHAELEGTICSGPRRGKHSTYALLDERVPRARSLTREEALAELTRRYFTSHGPATVRDYAWWSGLTVRDVKAGLAMLDDELDQRVVGEKTYWQAPTRSPAPRLNSSAYLLPNYDEYLVAYKDRELVLPAGKDSFAHHVIIDGRVSGTWKRAPSGKSIVLTVAPYDRPARVNARALQAAAERYGKFMGMPVVLA